MSSSDRWEPADEAGSFGQFILGSQAHEAEQAAHAFAFEFLSDFMQTLPGHIAQARPAAPPPLVLQMMIADPEAPRPRPIEPPPLVLQMMIEDPRVTGERREAERVASYAEAIRRAVDPAAVTGIIASRLPQRVTIDAQGARLELGTDNLLQLIQAIPGISTSELRSLAGPRTLTVNQDRFSLSGQGTFQVSNGESGSLSISLDNLSGRLRIDPANPDRILLSDVTGLTASGLGAQVNVREIALSLHEDADGNLSLRITPGQLSGQRNGGNGGAGGGGNGGAGSGNSSRPGLMDVYNQMAAQFGSAMINPIDVPLGHRHGSPMPQLFAELRGWAEGTQPRNAGRLAERISGAYVDQSLANIFTGIQGIEKNGDRITIRSSGSEPHNLGGLPIAWDRTVSARLESADGRLTLRDIEGLHIRLPVPNDVAASLGIRNPLAVNITELSLSAPDRDGNRVATMRTSGVLESVSIRVGPQLQPVTDRNGNATLSAVLNQDGRIPLELTFNPAQIAAGDLTRIDFRLAVGESRGNAARAVEQLLGCELSDALRGVLNGVESIERRGNTVSIRRRAASTHDLGGLVLSAGQEISFTLNPRADGVVEVSNISGINISRLPGFANTIYQSRLPIPIQAVTLGTANGAGERILNVSGTGALRQASVRLDRDMSPAGMSVEVVNPVQALIDSVQNRAAPAQIQQIRDRVRGTNTYVISIDRNGEVDLGSLGTLSSMFSNAGDFLSVPGAASTLLGAATGDQRAIPRAAERTLRSLGLGW